jgi:hypothetical protein
MERALFGDELLKVFKLSVASWFLTSILFCSEVLQVAPLYVIGATLWPLCQRSDRFVTGGQRLLATLLQICNRDGRGYWQPLTNSLKSIGNFCI